LEQLNVVKGGLIHLDQSTQTCKYAYPLISSSCHRSAESIYSTFCLRPAYRAPSRARGLLVQQFCMYRTAIVYIASETTPHLCNSKVPQ
jgi:hypothetical protein